MTRLPDTQRIILSQASQRDDQLAIPPERLPAAARQTVAKSLIKQALVSDEHASAHSARDLWQTDGRTWLLRITEAGLRAIGVEPSEGAAGPLDDATGTRGGNQPNDDEAQEPAASSDSGPQPDAALHPAASLGESQAAFPAPLPCAVATMPLRRFSRRL
ncbi:hypothetical protein GCM10011320_49080 [Neoroseomonas lacus]|uniref:Uncharacterized protein n=2 Tax=Neoroseomonas lacus TaxID=287609 RepID=A0A917L1N3_9PROT|nr:hypothetical protein GCM10011320_49080 [Neoroseomonas lacus]